MPFQSFPVLAPRGRPFWRIHLLRRIGSIIRHSLPLTPGGSSCSCRGKAAEPFEFGNGIARPRAPHSFDSAPAIRGNGLSVASQVVAKVVIIGAGVIGLGVDWRLAARDTSVAVFDQGAAGAGASHAAAGMLAA